MIEFVAAACLALVVFGAMGSCAVAFVRSCVATSGSTSMITVIALLGALLFSVPSSLWLVENTPLRSMNWGHAGAAFYPGYLIGTCIVFVIAIWKTRRSSGKVPSNHSVEADAG